MLGAMWNSAADKAVNLNTCDNEGKTCEAVRAGKN